MQLESIDPATGQVVGAVTITPVGEIAPIVVRARAAAAGWAALGTAGRAERLRPLAAAITARVDELANLLTREMGKPLRDAQGEIRSVAEGIDRELAEIAAA